MVDALCTLLALFFILLLAGSFVFLAEEEKKNKQKEYERQTEEIKKRVQEAIKIKDKILSLLQSNPEEVFTSQRIQIELKIENSNVISIALRMLKKEGKIKSLKILEHITIYTLQY